MSEKLFRSSSTLKLAGVAAMSVKIIAVCVIAIGYLNITAAQTKEDSTALVSRVEAYQSTFNTRDPEALAAFFSEDADFVMFNLPRMQGRQAIEKWWWNYWQSYFNKQEPERKGTFVINSIKFIADDVALVNIESTTGGRNTLGVELNTRKARGIWIMHKQNGNWFITAMIGMPTEEDQIIRNIVKHEIEVEGTFEPAGLPLKTPIRNEIGENCIIELKQSYNITGTLTGKLAVDFRILVYGPCGELPGTYNEEWIAFGSFDGTVDGALKSGTFTYTANVKAGGDVEGTIVFGQGVEGELTVKGNFKDGKLSYNGEIKAYQVQD